MFWGVLQLATDRAIVTTKRKLHSIPYSIKRFKFHRQKKKNGTLGCLFLRKIKFRSCQHPNEKHSRVLDSIVVGSHLHSQHYVPLLKAGVLTKDVS